MPSIFDSPAHQTFSIPSDFVMYMIENPVSAKVLEKLHQTCKYCFAKNQVVAPPILFCWKNIFYFRWNSTIKIKTSAKFWPTADLTIHGIDLRKFYRFSPKYLHIRRHELSWEEFYLLVAENAVEIFIIYHTQIADATVDIIHAKLPKVIEFTYKTGEVWSMGTLQHLNAIERSPKLNECELRIANTAEDFSPFLFIQFMLQNSQLNSRFSFHFTSTALHWNHQFAAMLGDWKRDNRAAYNYEWKSRNVFVNFLE